MKTEALRRELFLKIDDFLKKSNAIKEMSDNDRILKLSKPLTVIALNSVKKEV